jgi:hypothetical protein
LYSKGLLAQCWALQRRLRLPPAWSGLLALAAAAGFAAWRAASSGGAATPVFLHALAWPGAAVAGAVLLFAWLGWALDID